MVEVHGLAANIRSATESETFDLGGLSASTISTVVQDAFRDPFQGLDAGQMIRITLVVGAGKQARQKYDTQALKTVTSTLQTVGFNEDRGASCIPECAGMFKFQHDTGKNLKTVVVFPKVMNVDNHGSSATDTSTSTKEATSILKKGSMEAKVAVSSMPVFTAMVKSKCATWSQKKALLQLIDEELVAQISECDNLLLKGQPLSAPQQDFYDGCHELDAKKQHVQEQLHAHVELGNLTQRELDHLKEQVRNRIEDLEKQGKSTQKAKDRQSKLLRIKEVKPLPLLHHHAALGKLWKQLAPLQHLDENSNKLLSVHDTQLLAQKVDILEQIAHLEETSRGWLEDEAIFQERLKSARSEFRSKFGIGSGKASRKTSNSSKSSTTINAKTRTRIPVSKWVTPTETKASAKKKAGARLKKGDVFGAMMASTESDEEDSDDEEITPDSEDTTASSKKVTTPNETTNVANKVASKQQKKKNKKKGKGGKASAKKNNDVVLSTPADNQTDDAKSTSILSMILSLLLDAILWLVQLLFGKPKTKKKSKQG